MIWIFVAAAAGVLIAVGGVWWVRRHQLDVVVGTHYFVLRARCLKCDDPPYVHVMAGDDGILRMEVGAPVECPKCGARGVITVMPPGGGGGTGR